MPLILKILYQKSYTLQILSGFYLLNNSQIVGFVISSRLILAIVCNLFTDYTLYLIKIKRVNSYVKIFLKYKIYLLNFLHITFYLLLSLCFFKFQNHLKYPFRYGKIIFFNFTLLTKKERVNDTIGFCTLEILLTEYFYFFFPL